MYLRVHVLPVKSVVENLVVGVRLTLQLAILRDELRPSSDSVRAASGGSVPVVIVLSSCIKSATNIHM